MEYNFLKSRPSGQRPGLSRLFFVFSKKRKHAGTGLVYNCFERKQPEREEKQKNVNRRRNCTEYSHGAN